MLLLQSCERDLIQAKCGQNHNNDCGKPKHPIQQENHNCCLIPRIPLHPSILPVQMSRGILPQMWHLYQSAQPALVSDNLSVRVNVHLLQRQDPKFWKPHCLKAPSSPPLFIMSNQCQNQWRLVCHPPSIPIQQK